MPQKSPAHPGLASIDPLGAGMLVVCTIVSLAFFFHDTPLEYVVAATLAFYAVVALVIAITCRKKKVSTS